LFTTVTFDVARSNFAKPTAVLALGDRTSFLVYVV